MSAVSFGGQKTRGVSRCAFRFVRQAGGRRGDGRSPLFLYPVRGYARGARRNSPCFLASSFSCGACRRNDRAQKGDEGDFLLQSDSGTPASSFYICFRERRQEFLLSIGRESGINRGRRICGDERLSCRARSDGRRERHETDFSSRLLFRLDRCGERALDSGRNIQGGGGCDQRGDALSLRDAGKENLLRRRRLRHSHFFRFGALSSVQTVRSGKGAKENRRKGRRAPCGVRAFPFRAYGNRQLFLSRARRGRVESFSFLRFSRLFFREVPQENTSPRPARTGSPSHS